MLESTDAAMILSVRRSGSNLPLFSGFLIDHVSESPLDSHQSPDSPLCSAEGIRNFWETYRMVDSLVAVLTTR
jgi:hypothetical protein